MKNKDAYINRYVAAIRLVTREVGKESKDAESFDDLYSNVYWMLEGFRPELPVGPTERRAFETAIASMIYEASKDPETMVRLFATNWDEVSDEEVPWN